MVILKVGAEGGTLTLVEEKGKFYFSTDEGTLLDFVGDEFEPEDMYHVNGPYQSFDAAMEKMNDMYHPFGLLPLVVNAEYSARLRELYQRFLETPEARHNYHDLKWERALNGEGYSSEF